MKPAKKIEYLRAMDLAKLSDEEKIQYREDVMELRKKLRALVAYQDSSDTLDGGFKPTINTILKSYGLEYDRAEVSAKIMRVFFGEKVFFESIAPIYEKKAEYDNSDKQYKKTHDKVYAPVDYFDIPTLYHYYKFRQKILEKHQENRSGVVKYPWNAFGLDRIIYDASEEYFGKSGIDNMYYRPTDIRLISEPTKGYVNIGNLQARFLKEIEKDDTLTDFEKESMGDISIIDVIKGDINRYMMSYALAHSSSMERNNVYDTLVHRYSKVAVASIKKRCYVKKAEDYLLERHCFGLTDHDVYRIIPENKNVETEAKSNGGESKETESTGFGKQLEIPLK